MTATVTGFTAEHAAEVVWEAPGVVVIEGADRADMLHLAARELDRRADAAAGLTAGGVLLRPIQLRLRVTVSVEPVHYLLERPAAYSARRISRVRAALMRPFTRRRTS